jgi:hypothetical protein
MMYLSATTIYFHCQARFGGGVVQCSADVVLRPLKAMLHNKAKRDKTERIL